MNELYDDRDDLDPEELSGHWPVESSAEAVEGELQHRLEILRDRCACLSRDYEDLTAELTQFRVAYHQALGTLYVELERARLRVERLRTALDIVAQVPELPPEELLEWVATRTRSLADNVSRLEEEVQTDAKLVAEAERAREVSPDDQRLLRRLYRKLAIRFHPDLQREPRAKQECERLMARIGDLYRARDLEGLELVAEQASDVIKTVFVEPDEYRNWLHSRVERLEKRVIELEQQIDALWNSDLAVLKRRRRDAEQQGRDLFAEMAAAARSDIQEQETELGGLRAQVAALSPESQARIALLMKDRP
ncbi:MAG: hypothetical protein V2A79_00195 [Planctomycetota bacterium]